MSSVEGFNIENNDFDGADFSEAVKLLNCEKKSIE